MTATDDANNHLQAITNIFENVPTKKQVGILKVFWNIELKVLCGILLNVESLVGEFKTYLQYFEDGPITWPPQGNNHGQISNQQAEIKCQEFLSSNINNNNKNKTKDELSTTKADITNNTEKLHLVDLIDEGTPIFKDDPMWQTMSISAGIEPTIIFHIYRPKQPTEKTSKQSFTKAQMIRATNSNIKNKIQIETQMIQAY